MSKLTQLCSSDFNKHITMNLKKLITNVFKLKPNRIYAGKDLSGNKYYEIPVQTYALGMTSVDKPKRIIEFQNVQNTTDKVIYRYQNISKVVMKY